jgi:hypothetical protein
MVRPRAIDTAFQLTLAGILLGSVGTVVTTLLDHEEVVRLIRRMLSGAGQPYTEADVLGMIVPFRIAGGVGVAVSALLLGLVALRMRAGRNWARVVLTGFALLSMINFLSAVTSSGAALDLIWSLGGVAFSVAAVIYLFRPESGRFFAEQKRRR